jgi:sodium-dependent dicarboxylate transporter 2/3/5
MRRREPGVALAYAPAEAAFNRRRATIGLVGAPLVFVILLLLPTAMAPAAHRLAAVLALMIVLWMTEALPLAATALAGPTLAVLLGVAPAATVFAPFADPIIFLFIGSFMLAEAMFVHRLDRRLAFAALASSWIGRSGFRLVVVYSTVTCVISMWMSNTATTAMMFPLGLAVLGEIGRGRHHDAAFTRFMAIMLSLCVVDWRHGHAGRHAAEPHRQGLPPAGRYQSVLCGMDGARRARRHRDHAVRDRLARVAGQPRDRD